MLEYSGCLSSRLRQSRKDANRRQKRTEGNRGNEEECEVLLRLLCSLLFDFFASLRLGVSLAFPVLDIASEATTKLSSEKLPKSSRLRKFRVLRRRRRLSSGKRV